MGGEFLTLHRCKAVEIVREIVTLIKKPRFNKSSLSNQLASIAPC